MVAVLPRDILFRAGASTLLRYGTLSRRRTSRGWEDGKELFTRASTGVGVDRSGVGRVYAADQLRLEWVDLDGDGVREMPGFLLEGARTQLVTDPENFGAWTAVNTPVLTSGQADPFGGTAAYLLEDNDGANAEGVKTVISFTGDGTKTVALLIRQGTLTAFNLLLFDTTAGATRHWVDVMWTAGVPVLSTGAGSGTLFPVESWGAGWWRVAFNANGVVAANNNELTIRAGTTATGTVYIFGANAWDAPFPSSYQGPSGGATVRAADSLTFPIPWGPQDLTVYAKLARPAWADVSGSLGIDQGIFAIGNPTPSAGGAALGYGVGSSRQFAGYIDTPTTDQFVVGNIPSGTTLAACWQFRNLTSGGLVKLDMGSGFGAESSAGTAFSAWNGQTVVVGQSLGNGPLNGVLIDLVVAKGLRTLAEMQAVP